MGSEEVMGIQWVKGRGTSAEGQGLHKPWGGQQGGEGGAGPRLRAAWAWRPLGPRAGAEPL